MLDRLKAYAQQHDVPIISPATREFLITHLQNHKPMHCREVGGAIGYSSQHIGQVIKQRGGTLISCEISHPSYMLALWRTWQSQLRNITYYHANVLDLPVKRVTSHQLDFVFIDGRKSEYVGYLKKLLPHCGPGSTLLLDDVIEYRNKMRSVFSYLNDQSLSYDIIQLGDNDGLAVITVD